ncbi:Fe-S cluster assembly ATPase SufC [Spiroplasma turonicum]|uniref:FeS assembly ATPase SufC n=1 Tax=Spiroplasma turonicum TaxID=216946 RepID=A0A0K1P595_9MOLU|nr:Fe-S cluster assembly ATPase SufC [Spiroplasma turonicum]AKU79460.1 FeS assembly ATPase SufC [Spiroplasma turonicum]ALX70482.1 FeS assembly ATPase SufC [Spiroplasma turonicum]
MHKLEIKDLFVNIEDKEILKGINLIVNTGEIHALMGPNGNGKSTLLMTIMGHPKYEIISGDILIDDVSILDFSVDERSKAGLFLAMQNPQVIPGVTNLEFLKYIVNSHNEKPKKLQEIYKDIKEQANSLDFNLHMLKRFVNDGFSGGEKKKNEILQLKMLNPIFSLIDEIDSGLDVDALEVVANNLNSLDLNKNAMILVSHYDRFFKKVIPTHSHVIMDGKIVMSGGNDLVEKVNNNGYSWIKELKNNE